MVTDPYPRTDLVDLLDVSFFSSLMEEEERRVLFSLVYTSKESALTSGWSVIPLASVVLFTTESVRKLAPALDPTQTYMAVYPGSNGRLEIWGIINPNRGGDGYSEPLGLLLRVLKPGFLVVRQNLQDLLVYSRGSYMVLQDPFDAIDQLVINILFRILPPVIDETLFLPGATVFYNLASLMLAHGHGGTLLIVPNQASISSLQERRYEIDRESQGFLAKALGHMLEAEQKVKADQSAGKSPEDWHKDQTAAREARKRYDHLCHVVSKLTAIDGAVVLTYGLRVLTFGALIDFCPGSDGSMCSVTQLIPGETPVERNIVPLTSFEGGARHKSAIYFCYKNPRAIAFVASQDGTLSLFSKFEDQSYVLAVWPIERGTGLFRR